MEPCMPIKNLWLFVFFFFFLVKITDCLEIWKNVTKPKERNSMEISGCLGFITSLRQTYDTCLWNRENESLLSLSKCIHEMNIWICYSYWFLLDLCTTTLLTYSLRVDKYSTTLTCICPFFHCKLVFEVQPWSPHAEGSEMEGSCGTHMNSEQANTLTLTLLSSKCVHRYRENNMKQALW